ncbi:MAG: hypothetical protein K2P81_15040 [Bacteriovoracaceae bacterium]|nr:hypothetical protein [Bacteriovoracaceae bacterium]
MKAFASILLLALSLNGFSKEVTPLKEGDLHLSAARVELLSVRQICPVGPNGNRCLAYGSIATVKISMTGCLDRLGGYFPSFEVVDGKGILSVGAINIFNKMSMVARCVRMPSETVEIELPFEGEFEFKESLLNSAQL